MRLAELLRRTSHRGLGQTAGSPVRDTWLKFRPAYERRLIRGEFDPPGDPDAALAKAREIAGRDDAAAHFDPRHERDRNDRAKFCFHLAHHRPAGFELVAVALLRQLGGTPSAGLSTVAISRAPRRC